MRGINGKWPTFFFLVPRPPRRGTGDSESTVVDDHLARYGAGRECLHYQHREVSLTLEENWA